MSYKSYSDVVLCPRYFLSINDWRRLRQVNIQSPSVGFYKLSSPPPELVYDVLDMVQDNMLQVGIIW